MGNDMFVRYHMCVWYHMCVRYHICLLCICVSLSYLYHFHMCEIMCAWYHVCVRYHACEISCVYKKSCLCEISCVWDIIYVCEISCVYEISCVCEILCVRRRRRRKRRRRRRPWSNNKIPTLRIWELIFKGLARNPLGNLTKTPKSTIRKQIGHQDDTENAKIMENVEPGPPQHKPV